MEKNMNKKLIGIAVVLGFACVANAAISIYGSSTGYQSNDKDWMSNTTDDIDGNGLGTDGYIFFGDFAAENANVTWGAGGVISNMADTLVTDVLPSYVSSATMGANVGTKIGSYSGYEALDNPLIGDGTDGICGNITMTGAGEALNFTIFGLGVDETVRVGIVTVLNDDTRARFDTPTIGLSDGTDTLYVTGLPNLSSSEDTTGPGWVFFDITSDGDYTILIPPDASGIDPDVTGFGGVTFDTIPEPATIGMVLASAFGLLFIRRRMRS
jgi:hypothetical protein